MQFYILDSSNFVDQHLLYSSESVHALHLQQIYNFEQVKEDLSLLASVISIHQDHLHHIKTKKSKTKFKTLHKYENMLQNVKMDFNFVS